MKIPPGRASRREPRVFQVGVSRDRAAGQDEAPGELTYAAFISYSRAVDGKLAPAIQSGLERFAKPWWRVRVLRVFRDDASLTANPGLWSSIQEGLARSEHFILLASQRAAKSD